MAVGLQPTAYVGMESDPSKIHQLIPFIYSMIRRTSSNLFKPFRQFPPTKKTGHPSLEMSRSSFHLKKIKANAAELADAPHFLDRRSRHLECRWC